MVDIAALVKATRASALALDRMLKADKDSPAFRRALQAYLRAQKMLGNIPLTGDRPMFTTDNTTGYTQTELDALNAELAERLAAIDPDDVEARAEAEKAFSDEVSRRGA